ncbi:MAG TPA: GNAT family N-acetyltransferase [Bdellovibrionales bacterium]|nr:GNAT family N-acetyltransferase [Bdellovibrionales bacterium]
MSEWRSRRADMRDIASIDRIVNGAYRGESGMRGWTTEAHLLGGVRIDHERIEAALQSSTDFLLIAEDGNRNALGCVQLSQRENGVAFLSMLTVDVERQTGGIGKFLLTEAENFARSEIRAKRIEMFVIAIRTELVQWYERRGYQKTGLRHDFPKDVKFGVPLGQSDLTFVSLFKDL